MNKTIRRLFVILLLMFSFYYTNRIIDFLKEQDPIMKEIKKTKDKYKIKSVNAKIIDNNMIPGKDGKNIDYKKSYNKMKHYGMYNESLTVLKEVKPEISIDDNYDKYIISGNEDSRSVSLVFVVKKEDNIDKILKILEKEKVSGNFFIDGTYLENNVLKLKSMENHEIEILSYDNSYNKSLFETSISYLENIVNDDVKYCYSEKDNNKLIDLCKKNKLHTIKPTLIIKKNLYMQVKQNLSNGIIVSIDINNYNEKELIPTIDYIIEKGYKIVKLNELLSEKDM
ncbi:MAG: hypothetical protein IJ097_03635 [Bacilli bacterium]|nr:hypothetical protein [Bacilli bacterium]